MENTRSYSTSKPLVTVNPIIFVHHLGWCEIDGMRQHSVDLAERSQRISDDRHAQTSNRFDVSVASLYRWRTRLQTCGDLTAGRSTGRPRAIPSDAKGSDPPRASRPPAPRRPNFIGSGTRPMVWRSAKPRYAWR